MLIYTSENPSEEKKPTRKKFIRQKRKHNSISPVLKPAKLEVALNKSKGIKSMKIISLSEEFQDIPRTRFWSWNNENEQSLQEKNKIIEDEYIISRKPTIGQEYYGSKTTVKKELNIGKFKSLLEVPRPEMYGKKSENYENCSLVSSGESTPHLYVDYKNRIEGLLLLNFSSGDENSLCGSPNPKIV